MDQGEDPHRVPQHRVLRRGRVRDRVGRARVLRLEPPRLRAALRGGAGARRGRAAGGHDRLARRLQPGPEPGRRDRAAQPRAAEHARPVADHHERDRRGRAPGAAAAQPIQTPKKISLAPYFTAWIEDQLVDRYGSGTRSPAASRSARRSTSSCRRRPSRRSRAARRIGPSAALVAIDNDTGGIRAMVGGSDFEQRPFNLATQGRRQPGSASSRSR